MGWKYVMVLNKIGDTRFYVPIIFPDKLVHAGVYECLRPVMPGWSAKPGWGIKAVSAGRIEHLNVDGLGGGSTTLNLTSRETDAKTIDSYSYFHGIV